MAIRFSRPSLVAILRGGAVGTLAGLLLGAATAVWMAFIVRGSEYGAGPVAAEPFLHHGEWVVIPVMTIAGALFGSLGFGLFAATRGTDKGRKDKAISPIVRQSLPQ
jgi:hypothetical protein